MTIGASILRVLPRRLARADGDRDALDPVGHVLGRVLLEEELALPAVGVALHRERAVLQVRDEHRSDGSVVAEQVALRDSLLRPERLVEVRQPQDPLALANLVRERLLAVHLLGCLVVAQALVARARAGGRRASTRRTRPRATSFGSTQTTSPLRTVGIFGGVGERRGRALERLQQLQQPVDLVVGEAGPDVADVAQLAALVGAEDERAEPAGAPTLAAWCSRRSRTPGVSVRLDLAASRSCAGRACSASPACLAITPS